MEGLSQEWLTNATKCLLVEKDTSYLNWKELLSKTCRLKGFEDLKRVLYKSILQKYPLLEVTWVEYAEFIFNVEGSVMCDQIYEEAFVHLPRSLYIWNRWIDYQLEIRTDHDAMLGAFERARKAIGDHYHSWEFYEKYLKYLWDLDRIELRPNVISKTFDASFSATPFFTLLRYTLQVPMKDYLRPFTLFLTLLDSCSDVNIQNFINVSDLEAMSKVSFSDLSLDTKKLRQVKLELRKRYMDLFITTQYSVCRCLSYEKLVGMHNYEPDLEISRLELQAWRKYIEYAEVFGLKITTKESEKNIQDNIKNWIDVLYNRCLIRCANYGYFWMKWSNYNINMGNSEKSKLILSKALKFVGSSIYTPENIEIRLRLIDLHILDKELEKALLLCTEIVGTLDMKEIRFIIPIWEKVINIIYLAGMDKEQRNKDTVKTNMISIVKRLLSSTKSDFYIAKLLEYLSDYSIFELSDIQELQIAHQQEKKINMPILKRVHERLNPDLQTNDSPIPEGYTCEYF